MANQNAKSTRRKGPSLGDVARLAGVSPQTASRVSTGSDLVSPETEARVQAAMQRLGYVPNQAARALRKGAYKAIGVVTQQLERTGESLTLGGIVNEAANQGYSSTVIQISQPETAALQESLSRLTDLPIDGLIIVRIGLASKELVTLPNHLPVVVCDSKLSGFYPSVIGDQVQGVQELVSHLVGLGHRTIYHVAGAIDSHPSVVRQAAWQQAMIGEGLPPGRLWEGDWTIDSGYRAGLEIAEDPAVTAVFCGNDEMAFGLIRALAEKGLRVPEDISVVGFDGWDLSRFSDPPLTTIRQEFEEYGARAVNLLLDQIRGLEVPLDPGFTPVSLIVRESTAPPNPVRLARH